MKFFLAGTMRGSEKDDSFVSQDYRLELTKLIKEYFPGSEIYDPLSQCDIQDSNNCSFEEGKKTYLLEAAEVIMCDVLVAYLPEASMGTAIEMWQAHISGIYVVTITEMKENWTIKYLSNKIFSCIPSFRFHLRRDGVRSLIEGIQSNKLPPQAHRIVQAARSSI